MIMPANKFKRFIFWIFYIPATLLVVFFSLEVAVRLLKLAPHSQKQLGGYGGNVQDEYLPYKTKPHSEGCAETDEFVSCAKYNSLGFRDVEHTFEKPKGIFRILGLGDSFTEGAAVNFEETYLYILEKMLNSRGQKNPKVEIIKAGIGGYFPEPERILLQHYGVKFNPDLIIVGFLPNDIWEAYAGMGARKVTEDGYLTTNEAAQLGRAGLWLFVNSHLCRTILSKYIDYNMKNYYMEWSEIWYPNEKFERAWKKIELEYEKMIEIANQINAKIVFVHIPQQGPYRGPITYPNLRLYQWCKEQGVDFIDVLPNMIKLYERGILPYYRKDGHCNPIGYRTVAETIYDGIIEKNLVP